MDLQCDAEKQVVSPSLLPQKWEMEHIENFFDERFAFMDSEWLPRSSQWWNFIEFHFNVIGCLLYSVRLIKINCTVFANHCAVFDIQHT